MISELVKNDIVLIGEFHNNPISHWMELEITKIVNYNATWLMGARDV
jgi:uncharacterized iron-regulated protein